MFSERRFNLLPVIVFTLLCIIHLFTSELLIDFDRHVKSFWQSNVLPHVKISFSMLDCYVVIPCEIKLYWGFTNFFFHLTSYKHLLAYFSFPCYYMNFAVERSVNFRLILLWCTSTGFEISLVYKRNTIVTLLCFLWDCATPLLFNIYWGYIFDKVLKFKTLTQK